MKPMFARRLMFHGVLIFLIGLTTGFLLYFGAFTNSQIGLVAHLEGVLNGMFLAILGIMWGHLSLSERQQRLACVLAVAGAYMNISQALWSATLGRSRATPVFPADRVAFPMEKILMDVVLLTLSAAFVVCCLLVLWGLRSGGAAERPVSTKREQQAAL